MPAAAMGSATAKGGGGGSSDPNVLSLQEANRVRILEPTTYKWRQHYIESTTDSEQGRSVVCPKGPDGRDPAPCPLCMKPTDAEGKQRFSISRRFATNVWDYESGTVKVLIAGPQVYEEFDAYVALGMDPTAADVLIHKMGKGVSTSYKVIRASETPLEVQITPDMLHDLDKYDTPDSTERIFEKLEEMGWDYDSLEMPSLTLDQAENMQMPYGKFKGLTIEQIVANDPDYAQYIHGSKRDQGAYGDLVFVALQEVLHANGLVPALDDAPVQAPAKLASASPAAASPAPAPEAAPTPPVASEAPPVASGMVPLVGPDGATVEVPASAADALRATGYTDPEPEVQEPESLAVNIGGSVVVVDAASAKALIANGTATLAGDDGDAGDTPAPAPAYVFPADDAQVMFKLNVVPTPVEMAFSDARRLASEGQGQFTDAELAAAVAADAGDDKAVQQEVQAAAAADPIPAGGDPLDPALTQEVDGGFTHPAFDDKKVYRVKGAVTQRLNKLRGGHAPDPAPAAAANGTAPPVPAPTGLEGKLSTAKNLLRDMPEYQSDFKKLIALFEEVGNGKNQITEFNEQELDALINRLQAEKATA